MTQQRWLRIITVAFIMYTIAFVDRTNVSLALPSMSRDLHMDRVQAGGASGIFFIGYILLQIPSGYLASRWSAKGLVSVLLVVWGACAAAAGLVHTWGQLWVVRFLLGVAEGGILPATLVLVAHWFPRAERARANAYWLLCVPLAIVVSSPFSGWILARWNWRVLLVSEGLLPLAWLIIWITQIADYPRQARWISSQEREYLEGVLRLESAQIEPLRREPFLVSLFRPQVLVLLAVSFLVSTGNYGYLFWLPTELESSALSHGRAPNIFAIGVLNAIPYVIAAAGMVFLSRHSDRRHERPKHVAVALGWAGIFLLLSALVSQRSPTLAFVLLCLVGAGSYGLMGPFWAIPTETLPAAVAGSAIGLIQFSNLGGFLGPTLVGYLGRKTGDFTYAFVVMALGWLVAAFLCLLLSTPRNGSDTSRASPEKKVEQR